jgi:elongation factor P--(R)-beta-lysine ligase
MLSHRTDITFSPTASLASLEQRSALLRRLREFFYDRHFIEVETPLLAFEVIPELHIEPIAVGAGQFLQASPELHMKCLLAVGASAIFQITRSFRAEERGPLHNPEFTIVEWYRTGDDMLAGMDLLDELAQSLLGTLPAARTTYAEAFARIFGVCPHIASIEQLSALAEATGIAVPAAMPDADRDEWLNLLLVTRIEPQLGRERPEIIYHYPASQASLAKVVSSPSGDQVAERFELYYRGIELANGFHELTDAIELKRRLVAVSASRVTNGRPALPLPERLLAAMQHGLPDSAGCALGFDRLAMLAIGTSKISEMMTFPA